MVSELTDQSTFMVSLTSVAKQLNEKTHELLSENNELSEQVLQYQNELKNALHRQEVSTKRIKSFS